MGLGPPVCNDCKLVAMLFGNRWICPKCEKEGNDLGHLWTLSQGDQLLYEDQTIIFAQFHQDQITDLMERVS